jgi:hypothetical protein
MAVTIVTAWTAEALAAVRINQPQDFARFASQKISVSTAVAKIAAWTARATTSIPTIQTDAPMDKRSTDARIARLKSAITD